MGFRGEKRERHETWSGPVTSPSRRARRRKGSAFALLIVDCTASAPIRRSGVAAGRPYGKASRPRQYHAMPWHTLKECSPGDTSGSETTLTSSMGSFQAQCLRRWVIGLYPLLPHQPLPLLGRARAAFSRARRDLPGRSMDRGSAGKGERIWQENRATT